MTDLINALWITLIGMGLVFIALLLLWGLMELMMRFTAKSAAQEAAEAEEEEEGEAEEALPEEAPDLTGLRRQAAAAAVAVALALQPTRGDGQHNPQPVETVSPWQSVLRATQLNKRSVMYSRKQRGIVR